MNAKQAKWGLMFGVAGALLTVIPQTAAMASTNGERNTTIALGAATLYEALSGKTTNAAILGGATAIAYTQYENSLRNDQYANCAAPQTSVVIYGSDGFNQFGFDRNGYDRDGYNQQGFNRQGYNKDGRDRDGRSRDDAGNAQASGKRGISWNTGAGQRDQGRNGQQGDGQRGR